MIIYPPLIAETIPSFTSSGIVIPFEWNPAVGIDEVSGFSLQIKSYQSGLVIGEPIIQETGSEDNKLIYNNKQITFLTEEINDLQPGSYYKFQLMYLDNSNTKEQGTYSSASLGKYLGEEGKFSIDIRLNQSTPLTNEKSNIYYGYYTNKSGYFERPYSYQFILKQNNKIIDDTGECLYSLDQEVAVYTLNRDLSNDFEYTLQFKVTTVNGYKLKTKEYTINPGESINLNIKGKLTVESQDAEAIENGYVKIHYFAPTTLIAGDYLLERKEIDADVYNEVSSFTLEDDSWKALYILDQSIEQGKTYKYSITRVINQTLELIKNVELGEEEYQKELKKLGGVPWYRYSDRLISNSITTDFIHTYLTDGERQLKIKYNPKVSTFKNTLLEQKQDTIGGAYPFFFRNGIVKYKEIPISGLISYHLDDNEFFMKREDLDLSNPNENRIKTINENVSSVKVPTTSLVSYNLTAERKFKLLVLDWFNNGKPKLFRSPTEGNYVVRLMNVSLSPEDTVGRMLHSFSATGYECSDSTLHSLKDNKLINFPPHKEEEGYVSLTWKKQLKSVSTNDEIQALKALKFRNIKYNEYSPTLGGNHIILDNKTIYPNATGTYTTPENEEYSYLALVKENTNSKSTLTFDYAVEDEATTYNVPITIQVNEPSMILKTYEAEKDLNDLEKYTAIENISNIYSVQAIKKSKDSEQCCISIDDKIISLDNGFRRTWNYPDVSHNSQIKYQNGVSVTIFYQESDN